MTHTLWLSRPIASLLDVLCLPSTYTMTIFRSNSWDNIRANPAPDDVDVGVWQSRRYAEADLDQALDEALNGPPTNAPDANGQPANNPDHNADPSSNGNGGGDGDGGDPSNLANSPRLRAALKTPVPAAKPRKLAFPQHKNLAKASKQSGKASKTKVSIELASPVLKKADPRRSSMAFKHLAAIKQNNLLGGKVYVPDPMSGEARTLQLQTTLSNDLTKSKPEVQEITLNGVPIKLKKKPNTLPFSLPKRWTRADRKGFLPKEKEIYRKSATGSWVLPRDNKLQVLTIKNDDEKLLFSVKNLQHQLGILQEHCFVHDLDDVFTIVEPVDVANSPQIGSQTYNLFRDYATLHPAQIALSNAWYNTWVDDAVTLENLSMTTDLFKNNSEDDLSIKASIKHKEFAPIQQGGPLYLYFVLKRILNVSENSLLNLVLGLSRHIFISEVCYQANC